MVIFFQKTPAGEKNVEVVMQSRRMDYRCV
jgi:hypothetical protein